MSETKREGLYVYQPFGTVANMNRSRPEGIFAIAGLPLGATIAGLTRAEADAVLAALSPSPQEAKETPTNCICRNVTRRLTSPNCPIHGMEPIAPLPAPATASERREPCGYCGFRDGHAEDCVRPTELGTPPDIPEPLTENVLHTLMAGITVRGSAFERATLAALVTRYRYLEGRR